MSGPVPVLAFSCEKKGKKAGGTGFTQETDNCVDAITVDECDEADTGLPLFAKNQVLIKFSFR